MIIDFLNKIFTKYNKLFFVLLLMLFNNIFADNDITMPGNHLTFCKDYPKDIILQCYNFPDSVDCRKDNSSSGDVWVYHKSCGWWHKLP